MTDSNAGHERHQRLTATQKRALQWFAAIGDWAQYRDWRPHVETVTAKSLVNHGLLERSQQHRTSTYRLTDKGHQALQGEGHDR